MAKPLNPAPDDRISQLEDELKAAGKRIVEMNQEHDDAHERTQRMVQHVEESDGVIDSWIEAFEMQINDDGSTSEGWPCRAIRSVDGQP
jgi:predicted  nucleic acid-binding Zn-ribbon protein